MFISPTAQCTSVSYHPYLLVSPTAAAASSAAAKQRELALEAKSADPAQDKNLACPQGLPASPELTCSASKCQAVQ
ncbi:hypothetical protein [Aquabacterium sp.]|uniref:hypothetical protein n=1 Tax=Aquabacterium sp. TaxID=1872578 RepID=UPI002E2EEBBE|nr:hypothetical protein [Aquabacterium sp.]HEX5311241.1 hypothetical protein [Aquabacterium sp.]